MQVYADFETVQLRGRVAFASYAPSGTTNDVTNAINNLVAQNRLHIPGGIHTAIGDPFPNIKKQFVVYYQPSQIYNDTDTVTFSGFVKYATYGPAGSNNNVTDAVNNLVAQGRTTITGGIATAIGDPAFGVLKQFCVYYPPPDTFNDTDTVTFKGKVAFASYAPIGQINDVTAAVNNLIAQGRTTVQGGIATAIGDPAFGVKKEFIVYYAPSAQYKDFETVHLQGPVKYATYGPPGSNNNVTMGINNAVAQGRLHIPGGIHTVIGDPFPNVPKVFNVYY